MKFKNQFIKSKKKKKGFTLIELVAVLAIIAILSAAFVPKFSNYITEAKKVTVLNQAKNAVTAYEAASHKINTNEDNTTIASLINSNHIDKNSVNKLSPDFSIADCKNLMDTENFEFNIENGAASAPKPLTSDSDTDTNGN